MYSLKIALRPFLGPLAFIYFSYATLAAGSVKAATGNRLMDIVYIRDLRIETIIGIYDWEREVKQTISLDLEMAHDIRLCSPAR